MAAMAAAALFLRECAIKIAEERAYTHVCVCVHLYIAWDCIVGKPREPVIAPPPTRAAILYVLT